MYMCIAIRGNCITHETVPYPEYCEISIIMVQIANQCTVLGTHVLRNGPEACCTAELYKAVFLLIAEAGQPPVPLAEAIPHTRSGRLLRH